MIGVLLALAALSGQQTSVAIKPNTPFQIQWSQPGMDTDTRFRWWCDGAIVKNFSQAEAVPAGPAEDDGAIPFTATVPGLPLGNHVCYVTAHNAVGEITRICSATVTTECVPTTVPVLLPIGTVPAVPIRIKVIVPQGRGSPGR